MPVNKSKVKSQKSKVETKVVRKTAVRSSLSAPVYDSKGAKSGNLALPKEVFGGKINEPLMAQAVRVYLANQRIGAAKTQTRGEVTLTTAKWYRQKGTGRARHGAKSAPIFVGGGVAHGPRLRDFSLSMPQKMKKAALVSALTFKAKEGDVKVVSGLSKIQAKTKFMDQMVKNVCNDTKKKTRVLLITSEAPKTLPNVYKAAGNISNVEVLSANLLNTYQVLKHKNLIFMKESIEVLGGKK